MSDSSSSNETPDTDDVAPATVPPSTAVTADRPSRWQRARTRLGESSGPTRAVAVAIAAVVFVLVIGTAGYAIGHGSADGNGGSHSRHDRGASHQRGDRDKPSGDHQRGRDDARGDDSNSSDS